MAAAINTKRALNFLIDILIISIIAVMITNPMLYAVFYLVKYKILFLSEFELSSNQIFLPVFITYYFSFEYFYGKTIAKYLTNTKVVNNVGMKPSFLGALLRTITRLIPFEFVLIFYENRCLHDYFSRTFVVKENAITSKEQIA